MIRKILLMEPPWYAFYPRAYQPVAPLGLSYLAGLIEKDYDVVIYNPDMKSGREDEFSDNEFRNEIEDYKIYIENLNDSNSPIWHEVRGVIEDFHPDLVGMTVRTSVAKSALQVAKIVKEIDPRITTVIGGPHATALPEELLSKGNVDVIVIGEGEEAFIELIEKINCGKDLLSVQGLSFLRDGKVVNTGRRPLIANLDLLPFPAKHLILDRERMHSDHYCNIIATRGCPYHCIFCGSHNIWGRKIRYRSPENVVAEMRYMVKAYNSEFFSFSDDSFTLSKKFVLNVCELIKSYKWKGYFRWVCNTRSNLVDDELISAMKEAGCVAVALGIESGNQKTLDRMKKEITIEQSRRAVDILRKHKIKFSGQFLIGFPFDTAEEIWDTINFMKELDPVSISLNIATPLPGTELFDMAVAYHRIDPYNIDWELINAKSNVGMLMSPELRQTGIIQKALEIFAEQALKKDAERLDYRRLREVYTEK